MASCFGGLFAGKRETRSASEIKAAFAAEEKERKAAAAKAKADAANMPGPSVLPRQAPAKRAAAGSAASTTHMKRASDGPPGGSPAKRRSAMKRPAIEEPAKTDKREHVEEFEHEKSNKTSYLVLEGSPTKSQQLCAEELFGFLDESIEPAAVAAQPLKKDDHTPEGETPGGGGDAPPVAADPDEATLPGAEAGATSAAMAAASATGASRVPHDAVVAYGPVLAKGTATAAMSCSFCGSQVMAEKVTRVTFKRSFKVKCCTCNCRIVQLGRAYGGWPPAGWNEEFTEIEQQAFYLSIGPCTSMQAIKQMTERIFTKIYERRKSANRHSEEQPLSVWAARGYNIDDIKENTAPEDIVQHPVLKQLYRIHLDTRDDTTVEGIIAKNVMSARQSRVPRRTATRKSAAPALADGQASQSAAVEGDTVDAEAVEENNASPTSEASSNSDSESSSSSEKKKKKHKKSKKSKKTNKKQSKKDKNDRPPKETDKERREREKREAKDRKERQREEEKRRLQELKGEKEREKEEAKRERQEQAALAKEAATNRSTANSLIGPLSSNLAMLDSCVNHKRMKDVPGTIAENVKKMKQELDRWHRACTKSLGDGTPVGGRRK